MLEQIKRVFKQGVIENGSGCSNLSDEQVKWMIERIELLEGLSSSKVSETKLKRSLAGYITNLVDQREQYKHTV